MNMNLNNLRVVNDENQMKGSQQSKKFNYFPMTKLLMKKSRRTVLGSIDANAASKEAAAAGKRKSIVQETNTSTRYNYYKSESTSGAAAKQQPNLQKYQQDLEKQMMEEDPTTPLLTYKHMLQRQRESPKMDLVDEHDPQACTDYVKDIQEYLREAENKYKVEPSYMKAQREITSTMRKILVDWLIDVHYKFRMKSETLYLTIHIIDRYLAKRSIARNELQLVGVTSLLIAAKYEEIYPPRIRRLLSISADFYKRHELLAMERDILNVLDFNITSVTTYQFLHRFAKAAKATDRIILLIFYFAELSQLDINTLNFSPSLLAAACVYNACALELRQWDNTLQYYTQYSEAEVLPCAHYLLKLGAGEKEQSKLNSIRKKWGRSSRHRISSFIPQDCDALLRQAPFTKMN